MRNRLLVFYLPLAGLLSACGNNEALPTANDSCMGNMSVDPIPISLAKGDSVLVTAWVDPCHAAERVAFSLDPEAAVTLHVRSDTSVMVVGTAPADTRLLARAVADGPIMVIPVIVQ